MLISVNYKNQKIYNGISGDAGQVGACLKYLCGFLLSLRAQDGAVEHLKSK
jgi:hypothetical protein